MSVRNEKSELYCTEHQHAVSYYKCLEVCTGSLNLTEFSLGCFSTCLHDHSLFSCLQYAQHGNLQFVSGQTLLHSEIIARRQSGSTKN